MTDVAIPLPLFGVAPVGGVRHADPHTSREAARQINPSCETDIQTAFYAHGPMTDDELAYVLRFSHPHGPSVKTARSRLSKRGVLVDSGETRLSACNRPMIVWRLA